MGILSSDKRLCPYCGLRTDLKACPTDGASTVVLVRNMAPMNVKIGDRIGERYRIDRVLGEGGYSSVYAGAHLMTGQRVAVKVLKAAHPGPDEQAVQRFFREARVTAGLVHPNTIRVFDVGQTEGGAFWLAMELLQGPSLEEVLQRDMAQGKVLTEQACIDFAVPVLRSLHEAHGHALVHRDLKPANIMLADLAGETVVKVLDFGIAQTRGSTLTTTGMALGTPAYMSPEQCQGLELDGRSDLYSLGIVLYRCVTGDVPFADHNPVKLMQAHLSRPLPDVRAAARTTLSPAFVEVIERALIKDKTRRFQTAQQMREALELASRALSRTALDMQAFRLPEPPPKPKAETPPVVQVIAPATESATVASVEAARFVPTSLADLLRAVDMTPSPAVPTDTADEPPDIPDELPPLPVSYTPRATGVPQFRSTQPLGSEVTGNRRVRDDT